MLRDLLILYAFCAAMPNVGSPRNYQSIIRSPTDDASSASSVHEYPKSSRCFRSACHGDAGGAFLNRRPPERIRAGINIVESAGNAYPFVYARRAEFHFREFHLPSKQINPQDPQDLRFNWEGGGEGGGQIEDTFRNVC